LGPRLDRDLESHHLTKRRISKEGMARIIAAKSKALRKATAVKNAPKAKQGALASEIAAPRPGSKTAQVVAMLRRKNGATLAEIMETMGWQKHTVRGPEFTACPSQSFRHD
jgi:hypothetical protein